jgi:hypothetical protein
MKDKALFLALPFLRCIVGLLILGSEISSLTRAAQGLTLGEAVDAPQLIWTTSGDAEWFGEATTSHDSVSAAQSGAVTVPGQESILETTVSGPGTLTF